MEGDLPFCSNPIIGSAYPPLNTTPVTTSIHQRIRQVHPAASSLKQTRWPCFPVFDAGGCGGTSVQRRGYEGVLKRVLSAQEIIRDAAFGTVGAGM